MPSRKVAPLEPRQSVQLSAGGTRIVHVLAPAPFGGLEQVVRTLAAAQRRSGADVHAVLLLDAAAPHHPLDVLRGDGVQVHALVHPTRAYLARVRALRDVCRDIAAEVVHSHGYLADVLLALTGVRVPYARVSTAHGFSATRLRGRSYEWLQCRSYRRFGAAVAVSRRLGDDLRRRGVAPDRLHVVPNAWASDGTLLPANAARQALRVPAAPLSIGWVGRVSIEKGLDILLEALGLLHDLPFQLTVVGDGPEVAANRQLAQARGVASRITWAGVLPDASRYMSAFDLFVMSSRTEGTPMVLLEAMAAGVPVAVTAVGGIPDVISPDQGLLVPPLDPAALAEAIRAVFRDREAARVRAENARARLESSYGVDQWRRRYDDIYEQARSWAQRPNQ